MKQALFWSKNEQKLNKGDEIYQVNQVLMYGSLEEIKEILNKLGRERVKHVFIENPAKIYTKPAFNFIKNYILKIEEPLDQSKYVKTLY